MKKTIHLIGNAHLDPVWLWDRRDGLNEGITTIRTILELMEEFEEMTFIRGESVIYQHLETYDRPSFEKVVELVHQERWDVVGGTVVQPDTNLTGEAALLKHFEVGCRYFASRFGKKPTAAWQADSFGHSSGLPGILARSGMDFFAFSRPQPSILPLEEPAFWWLGPHRARILSYRIATAWYGSDRGEMLKRLDDTLAESEKSVLRNVACFYGLGNHGGGPSRRHLREIREWAKRHPEVEVVHSGLHRLADALREELAMPGAHELPEHRGELNFCLRGCYSSVAKFKFPFRKCERKLSEVEATCTAIGATIGQEVPSLDRAWETLLFNSFHDILPGSSIERAMNDQIDSLGSILHEVAEAEFAMLNRLAAGIDTSLTRKPAKDHPSAVPVLVWNPLPYPVRRLVEVETNLDYRPIYSCDGKADHIPLEVLGPDRKPLSFQRIPTEHHFFVSTPWRSRVLLPLELPSQGWNIVEQGWVEKPKVAPAADTDIMTGKNWIANERWKIQARAGKKQIDVFKNGKPFFGKDGLRVQLFDDPWGSWGGMQEEPASFLLTDLREEWAVEAVEVLEQGPLRAKLWVQLKGQKSHLDLTFALETGGAAVAVEARLLFDERSARLKLVFPVGDEVEYDVPGDVVRRKPCGEVPGGRWARVLPGKKMGGMVFASDSLSNFDSVDGCFRATIARATHYADDKGLPTGQELWRSPVDQGFLDLQFAFSQTGVDGQRLYEELVLRPVVLPTHPKVGALPRSGSCMQPSQQSNRALTPT